MPYYIRRMRKEDVTQVTEIDREAYSTMWPPVNFRYELRNRVAYYVVACKTNELTEVFTKVTPEKGLAGLLSRMWRLSCHNKPKPPDDYVAGFAGSWILADEAHLTNIAVREVYRQQGIGELLLIATLDLATQLNVRIITLEVRTSNTIAQQLYQKYGFTQSGQSPGYYTDNGEDALIMSNGNITSAPFQERFRQLKQAHIGKWGYLLIPH